DKVPDHAAVNEAVEFVKKLQGQKPADFTNAILRNIIRNKNAIRYPDPEEDLIGYLASYYSHPSWMVKRYLERFGKENVEKLLTANNERPYLTLKVNTLKISPDEFKKLLNSVNLKYNQGKLLPEFFKLLNLTNIVNWEYFNEGFFDIQDESAGLACKLLGVERGMRVLDMCAAPGGKSSFLAGLMHDEGEIISLDKFESRVGIVKRNIERLGYKSINAIVFDALEYDNGKFDRILADVPCSGTGTLAKKPDIKWKKELLDVRKMNEIQYQLLEKAASLIKDGGAIVYSTCSLEPEENILLVKKFLNNHPEFKLQNAGEVLPKQVVDEEGFVQTFPHIHQTDGAFAAKLIKI
ncbi:MAG: 16S rRNA (cytosine(967)-C(5))-methyltransferase RsmB, partial [Syntrophothermus sp.]